MTFLKKKIIALLLALVLAMPVAIMAPVNAFAETTDIVDERTPLGAAEDLCSVHWIVLILSVALGGYTAVRVISTAKQENEESEHETI